MGRVQAGALHAIRGSQMMDEAASRKEWEIRGWWYYLRTDRKEGRDQAHAASLSGSGCDPDLLLLATPCFPLL